MRITQGIDELRSWILSCGLPRKKIARGAGLDPRALRYVTNAVWNPKAETLRKLEVWRSRLNGEGKP